MPIGTADMRGRAESEVSVAYQCAAPASFISRGVSRFIYSLSRGAAMATRGQASSRGAARFPMPPPGAGHARATGWSLPRN